VGVSVYSPIVARQRLGKHVPAAANNCCRRSFLEESETEFKHKLLNKNCVSLH
jgi:hypothetical protein